MFSYNMPCLKLNIDRKRFSRVLAFLYFLGLIPMLVIAFYDWPSVDDFSMPLQVHQTFVSTGSVLSTLGSVFTKTVYIYNNWIGYFFSDFVTCLCPSIWGEKWYFLTAFVVLLTLTICVLYFFDALFVKVWGMDGDLSGSAAFLTLLVMVHSMENGPARAEAFYWWSGAINYTFMFALSMLWIGMVFRQVFESPVKKGRFAVLCVLGFLLGGANYMTALMVAVVSVLGLFILLMIKLGRFTLQGAAGENGAGRVKLMWLPCVLNLAGLVVSAAAPGNRIRGTSMGNIGPLKAVLRSYFSVFEFCAGEMMRWEVLLTLVILAVIFWKMAEGMKHTLAHPFVFGAFSLSMMAVCIVPPLYAVGNIDAPRIHSTMWLQFVAVLVVSVFYYVAWVRQQVRPGMTGEMDALGSDDGADLSEGNGLPRADGHLGSTSSVIIMVAVFLIVFGSVLCIYVNPAYYSGTSAVYDLESGNAAAYRAENEARLQILNDDSISDAVLPAHEYKPELLFQGDIYQDPTLWENEAVATYYGKDSVRLGQ